MTGEIGTGVLGLLDLAAGRSWQSASHPDQKYHSQLIKLSAPKQNLTRMLSSKTIHREE
jgi:hypothetical protein